MKRLEKSTLYGVLYLALIPVFAFLYSAMPDAFHQSTSTYERNLATDYGKIKEELRDWLIQNQSLRQGQITGVTELETDRRSPGGLWSNMYLKFHLEVDLIKPNGAITSVGLPMSAHFQRREYHSDVFAYLSDSSGFLNPDLRGVSYLDCNEDNCELDMPKHLADLLEGYHLARTGVPSRASGNFERMLYLSAVTATTVGYGDIVPITRESRLLVAFEAVLEIVVIGLFLNALANKRGATSSVVRNSQRHHIRRQKRLRR